MRRHLLSAADLTRADAELILETSEEMRSLADRPIKKLPALRETDGEDAVLVEDPADRPATEEAGANEMERA